MRRAARVLARVKHTAWPQPILNGLEKLGIDVQPFLLFREGLDRSDQATHMDVRTRRLERQDMPEIVASAQRSLTLDELESRLDRCQQCLGLEVDGRLAAFTWWNLQRCDYKGLPFSLAADEAYLFDAYTFPAFRGRGLAPVLRRAAYEELARCGRATLFSISDRYNTPAVRFKEKLGGTVVAEGVFIGVGKLRRCFIVRSSESRFVEAAAPCYLFSTADGAYSPDDVLLGRLQPFANRIGATFLPTLVCGPLGGYRGHCLIAQGTPEPTRRRVVDLLLDGIHAEAKRLGVGISFVNAGGESPLASELKRRGYAKVRHLPLARLDLRWDSFEEYQASLSGSRRREIRRESKRAASRGIRVELCHDVTRHGDLLDRFLADAYQGHNGLPFPFARPFLRTVQERLGEAARVWVATKGRDPVGVMLELAESGTVQALMIGLDTNADRSDYTYFVLGYNTPIAEAIARGDARIYDGNGNYWLKLRRGFVLEDLDCYHRAMSAVGRLLTRLWCAILSFWLRFKVRRVRVVERGRSALEAERLDEYRPAGERHG